MDTYTFNALCEISQEHAIDWYIRFYMTKNTKSISKQYRKAIREILEEKEQWRFNKYGDSHE